MKSTFDILKIISDKIKKIIWILALRAFLIILLFCLIDLLLGVFIFYQYVYLAEIKAPEATGDVIKFNDKAYQDVLDKLQIKNENASQGNPIETQPDASVQP